jgi:PhoPQ-activated pathogenicity-related protein
MIFSTSILFQIGTPSSKLISKTLLNTKRRILLRGSFVESKEKAFETGGENFNLENASQNITHLFLDYLEKNFEKNLKKEFIKTKHVVQVWSKMLKMKKKSIHAHLMRIYWFHSKQPLHLQLCKLVQLCTSIFSLVCVGINHQKGGD